MPLVINEQISISEDCLEFRFSRAGGPGGQNVNKVSSRVELSVDLERLPIPAEARARLRAAAGRRVTADGCLTLACQASRQQAANRAACLERLRSLILAALVPRRARVPTRPSARAAVRRLEKKARRASTKRRRREPGDALQD